MEVEEETADREPTEKWVVRHTLETIMELEVLEDGTMTITVGLADML
jgi:hypothetical protein